MKKLFAILFAALLLLGGCRKPEKTGDTDIDLTAMSSTMIFSEVYNMMNYPEQYLGKTVKMQGTMATYEGEDRNYYACIVPDAAGCCSSGIEFTWAGEHKYPEDYPEDGQIIVVTGVFETYKEGEYTYCQLGDAQLWFADKS